MNSRSWGIGPVVLLALGVAMAGCGGGVPAPTASASSAVPLPSQGALGSFSGELIGDLRTETDVYYTDVVECGSTPCRVPGDVLAPPDGASLPTVVMLNGGATPFERRRYQAPLAVDLANRGAVVFLLSYRSIASGSYVDQDSWNDTRCAVRYARAMAEEYGGDPRRVVIVGHSQGGLMGIDIAIHPEEEADGCLADGSGKPDGVVALGAPRPSLHGAEPPAPPIWVFNGSEDRPAEVTAELLRDRGFDAEAEVLPGIDHDGITDPARAPGLVDLIVEALESI